MARMAQYPRPVCSSKSPTKAHSTPTGSTDRQDRRERTHPLVAAASRHLRCSNPSTDAHIHTPWTRVHRSRAHIRALSTVAPRQKQDACSRPRTQKSATGPRIRTLRRPSATGTAGLEKPDRRHARRSRTDPRRRPRFRALALSRQPPPGLRGPRGRTRRRGPSDAHDEQGERERTR